MVLRVHVVNVHELSNLPGKTAHSEVPDDMVLTTVGRLRLGSVGVAGDLGFTGVLALPTSFEC